MILRSPTMSKLKDIEGFDEIIDSQNAENPGTEIKPRTRELWDRKIKASKARKKLKEKS